MVYDARNEAGPPDGSGGQGGGAQAPEPTPPETAPAEGGKRRRGGGGEKTLTLRDGRQFVRDGNWWVDKSVVDDYARRGIDLLNDPNPTPDMIAAVEGNRVEYSQGRNMAARGRKQAAWRENSETARGFSQQYGGVPYFAGMEGFKKARALGLNTDAIVDDEGGDLALYLLNNQISLAQKPDGTWGFINTGHDPRDPNAQWVGATTGAGGVASGLNWERFSGKPTPPGGPPTDPPQPAPGQTPNAEKIVNGILYRQQPDGTWLKVGPAPTGGGQTTPGVPPNTTRPPQPAPQTNRLTPNTGMGQPLVQPTLSRMNMGQMPSVRPDAWWKGAGGAGGAADTMPQMSGMPAAGGAMKPFAPKAPAMPSLTTPKPTFGGIKLK